MSTEFLSRHLFDHPQVRGTITGGYEVTDPDGVRWLVCGDARRGWWHAFPELGPSAASHEFSDERDVDDLVVRILEGRR